jgi:hypothetical protein
MGSLCRASVIKPPGLAITRPDLPEGLPADPAIQRPGGRVHDSVPGSALIADNLDVGRPANVEIILNRHIRRDIPGVLRTTIDRIETVVNAPRDLAATPAPCAPPRSPYPASPIRACAP